MKRFLLTLLTSAGLLSASAHATDVGVSISIGQPGFYGQIDIGGYPRPTLIYPQPVLIERVPVYRAPIYLRVPPGHAKHWSKHCHQYGACGERVYFVQDDWYDRVYAPQYRERHGHRDDHYYDKHNGKHKDKHNGKKHRDD
jgi:hypothetical protein